jgi:hypothetical protein
MLILLKSDFNNVPHLASVGRFLNTSGSFRNYRRISVDFPFAIREGLVVTDFSGYFTWVCWILHNRLFTSKPDGPFPPPSRGTKFNRILLGLYQINIQRVCPWLLPRLSPLLNLSGIIKPPRLFGYNMTQSGPFIRFYTISVAPPVGWLINYVPFESRTQAMMCLGMMLRPIRLTHSAHNSTCFNCL